MHSRDFARMAVTMVTGDFAKTKLGFTQHSFCMSKFCRTVVTRGIREKAEIRRFADDSRQ
jgi:hypothetical protein